VILHATSDVRAINLEVVDEPAKFRDVLDFYRENVSPINGGFFGSNNEAVNWCEYAGRLCYQSLEKGRPSLEYHRNILKSGHFSIYGHALIVGDLAYTMLPFSEKPNLRHLIENGWLDPADLFPLNKLLTEGFYKFRLRNSGWASVVLTCSRYCSHELIRHNFPGVSQTSTRYCSEVPNHRYPQAANVYFHPWAAEIKSGDWRQIKDHKLRNSVGRHAMYPSQPTRLMLTTTLEHWEQIVKARVQPEADPEINWVVLQIADVLFQQKALKVEYDGKTRTSAWPERRAGCPNLAG
jgi:hypothetical protein